MNTTELLELITGIVSRQTGLPPDQIRGKRRDRATAWARMVCMWCALQCPVELFGRRFDAPTMQDIGYFFKQRDHGTVCHARKSVQNTLDTEPPAKAAVDQLMAEIRSEIEKREKPENVIPLGMQARQ